MSLIGLSKEDSDKVAAAVTPELAEALKNATSVADIQSVMRAQLERQSATAVTTSTADADKAAADAKAAADKVAADAAAKAAADAEAAKVATPATVSRKVVIAGKEFDFEAGSELELERMINVAFQTAYEVGTRETPVDPAVAAKAAADKAAADTAARTELDLKFKRGEISTTDYLEQSGAFAEYMAKNGVPLNELKAQVEQGRTAQFTNSWAAATDTFLNSPAGADWPGGDANKEILGLKLAELGLIDAEDKVGALTKAYNELKGRGVLHPYVPPVQADAAAVAAKAAADKATADAAAAAAAGASSSAAVSTAAAGTTAAPGTPEFTAAVNAAVVAALTAMKAEAEKKTPSKSSSVFGASSGAISNAAGAAEREVSKTVAIPADATPAEIMEAWKQQVAREGKDPNAEFKSVFSTRR
jgi:trimeric autotransporter adhesin